MNPDYIATPALPSWASTLVYGNLSSVASPKHVLRCAELLRSDLRRYLDQRCGCARRSGRYSSSIHTGDVGSCLRNRVHRNLDHRRLGFRGDGIAKGANRTGGTVSCHCRRRHSDLFGFVDLCPISRLPDTKVGRRRVALSSDGSSLDEIGVREPWRGADEARLEVRSLRPRTGSGLAPRPDLSRASTSSGWSYQLAHMEVNSVRHAVASRYLARRQAELVRPFTDNSRSDLAFRDSDGTCSRARYVDPAKSDR